MAGVGPSAILPFRKEQDVSNRRMPSGYREQIAEMAGRGLSKQHIATALGVSVKTVERHLPRAASLSVPGVTRTALVMTESEFMRLPGGNEKLVAADLMTESLRTRIMAEVANHGPYDTVKDLMRAMRRPGDNYGAHEVTHILRSLNRQGLVVFTESKRNTPGSTIAMLERIRATSDGFRHVGLDQRSVEVGRERGARHRDAPKHPGDRTDFRTHGQRAEGGPIERRQGVPGSGRELPRSPLDLPPVASMAREAPTVNAERPEPESQPDAQLLSVELPVTQEALEDADAIREAVEDLILDREPEWPELAAIRAKWDATVQANARADAYLHAAEALNEVDPDQAQLLVAKAEGQLDAIALTPLEAEYMRHVDWMARHTK